MKELTGEIKIREPFSEETLLDDELNNPFQGKNVFNSGKPFTISTVMFESSQRKAEKLVPYAIAFIMSAVVIFLIAFNKKP